MTSEGCPEPGDRASGMDQVMPPVYEDELTVCGNDSEVSGTLNANSPGIQPQLALLRPPEAAAARPPLFPDTV